MQHFVVHSHAGHRLSQRGDHDLVVPGGGAEDSRVFGQITLRHGGHDAAPTGNENLDPNRLPYGEGVAHPVVLHEATIAGSRLNHQIGAEPPGLEASFRIALAQPVERRSGQQVNRRRVEERSRGRAACDRLIGNRFSIGEAFDIRSVFFETGRLRGHRHQRDFPPQLA